MAAKRSARGGQRAGGDIITVNTRGNNNAVAVGRKASASISHGGAMPKSFDAWQKQLEKEISAKKDLPSEDKADLRRAVSKFTDEAKKGSQADAGRLERLINTIGAMAPDIFEVAIATLGNPLAGIGLVVKKIGDKAKMEAKKA